ncbi:hypothetical protein [Acaryochloris sp. CCMEE 5410]|uniref:hypothetical protein n=1 Tax=Acaryochloris sp. CCMEE 5410 TaxID=310037 RepID=UPI0002485156|nr:hypothetical protein [Acaryochloris sp. CCMEE 5410]KAI9130133.1 hypothetical protein ON05_031390 [Acaryochloris sp. CCMEE 5410]
MSKQTGLKLTTIFVTIPFALAISTGLSIPVVFSILNALGMPDWSAPQRDFGWLIAALILSAVSYFVVSKILDENDQSQSPS